MIATKTRKKYKKVTSHSITKEYPLDIEKFRDGYPNDNSSVNIPIALENSKVARFVPRDDQLEILNFLFKQHFSKLNTCVQSPTGAGKGYMLSLFVANIILIGDRKKILIIVPSKELVEDIAEYFSPLLVTKVYTGSGKIHYTRPIMISTYQSVKRRINRFSPDLIISDEAHRVACTTWHNALMTKISDEDWLGGKYEELDDSKEFLRCQHHGFTATPARLDRKNLRPYFDLLWVSPSVEWYVSMGILPDFELYIIDCPGFSTQTSKNDNLSKQSEVFGSIPEIEKTVNLYQEKCVGEAALFFVTGVKHGDKMVELFAERNIHARFIHSKTPKAEREKDFEEFREGVYDVLINITIFKEGVNINRIQNLFLCRFTYSLSLFMQMSGRLFRWGQRKRLYDLVGNTYYHGSPKLPFDWQLDCVQEFGEYKNSRILCPHCDSPLFERRYLSDEYDYHGCCSNCQEEVHIYSATLPELEDDEAEIEVKETDFNLFDSSSGQDLLSPTDISRFTRILFHPRWNTITKVEKICNIKLENGQSKELEEKAKYAALIKLGLNKNTAEYYAFDD